MATTLNREATEAARFFKEKLEFEVGPIGLYNQLKNGETLKIIDLRTPELYAKGHVSGAINVQFDQLDQHLSKLDPNVPTVVYCYDIVCHLATKAALHLAEKGYKVKELVGGYEEWEKRGLASETVQASSCSTSGKSHSCG